VKDIPAGTYYITRDSSSATGELVAVCDVWRAKPDRVSCGTPGHCWLSKGPKPDLVIRVDVKIIMETFGTVPETDRECLRVMV
jgi:hypothetical protein